MTIVVDSQLGQSQIDSSTTQIGLNQVENVVQNVENSLKIDNTFPHLFDLLKGTKNCSVSGLQDNDYPNLQEFGTGLNSLSQFSSLQTIPIPSGLQEQFAHMQQNCEMGIFPEIKRAWVSIDSNLYLWAYDNGTDVAYYDALNETILNVGLIKPKEDVFKSHIKYLMCITTAVEIILLGLTFNTDDQGEVCDLVLVPDKMFSIPTDNIIMDVIQGTINGRIFLGGKDGCIYEVIYQARGWFTRNCRKVNHSISSLSYLIPSFIQGTREDAIIQIDIDESRHILYSLSKSGSIEVYDLGQDGTSMYKVISKSLSSIVKEATTFARTIDQANFKPIIGISALRDSESIQINLIAITESGLRLYFTTNFTSSLQERPNELRLIHIRLPPGFSASSPYQKPSFVHTSNFNKGNLIMISSSSQLDNKDILWAINNDMFAYENDLMELYTVMPLNCKVWKMAEEPRRFNAKSFQVSTLQNNKLVLLDPPSIITQHFEEPRKFVFLSSQGVHIGFKPRVVDQLKQLLTENQGFDNPAVKSFFEIHKRAQACAIALILACGCKGPQDAKVSEWATNAIFRFGGEPHYETIHQTYPMIHQQLGSPLSAYNQHNLSFNPPLFSSPIQHSVSPTHLISPSSMVSPGKDSLIAETLQAPSFYYSDKHDGVYLYFTRIIRPIWFLNAVKTEQFVENNELKEKFTSLLSPNEIYLYVSKLNEVKNFLKEKVQFSINDDPSNISIDKRYSITNDAHAKERNSLYNLMNLIKHCIEVLGLWKMLCDHQFEIITSMLPIEKQTQLKTMTFRDLFIFGNEMTSMLASSLVRRCIEDNITTDIISKRLQDVCPSIYKQENALHAKAHEIVMKSKTISNHVERNELLKKALDLCLKIGERINLTAVCELFQSVHWYEAIVNLCLITAQKRDPQNFALHFYQLGEPNSDQQGRIAYNNRIECYCLLLEVYEKLVQLSKLHIKPKTSDSSETEVLTFEEAQIQANKMLELALNSKDELFHISLYNWLYEHQQSEKLLEIKSPYLESYLKRKTSIFSDSIALMDLLWMYYERNGHFRAAAQILNKLAERRSNEVTLRQRIEYLSRAIVCMKSSDSRASTIGVETTAGEFLHELEEKMEVARVQNFVLESIESFPETPSVQEAIGALNYELFDISKLYGDFADPFNLPECQLAILHCAGHYDPTLIETLWQKIIDNQLNKLSSLDAKESQKVLLSNKIIELGKHYLQIEKYFPLDFIIKYLEVKTQNFGFEPEWLAEALLSIGLSLPSLLDFYHKLYKSRETSWPRKSVQLLKVILYLISSFINNPNQLYHPSERRLFATKCLDVIVGYIIDLQSLGSNETTLAHQFKKLKSNLERDL